MNDETQLKGTWRKFVSSSNFLASDDFDPGAPPVRLTISGISLEMVPHPRTKKEEQHAVAHFDETDKMFCLNVTKCRAIAAITGTNRMEQWPGTRIGLKYGTTKVQGQTVGCITVTEAPQPRPD